MSWFGLEEAVFPKDCLTLNLRSNANQLPNQLNVASAVSNNVTPFDHG